SHRARQLLKWRDGRNGKIRHRMIISISSKTACLLESMRFGNPSLNPIELAFLTSARFFGSLPALCVLDGECHNDDERNKYSEKRPENRVHNIVPAFRCLEVEFPGEAYLLLRHVLNNAA